MTTLARRESATEDAAVPRQATSVEARAASGTRTATAEARTAATTRAQQDADALALLTLLADLPKSSPDRARARERLVEMYLPLAEHLARRFRHRTARTRTSSPSGASARHRAASGRARRTTS